MAIESPLFQSAMELIGHSISHYNGNRELDRKLLILHLANAVELILKDIVLDSGCSIYKNPKETITIQGCLSTLEKQNIEIPNLNKIELLIDERNALQHRFGSPNELTSIFYMNIAQQFFQEVLRTNYGQDYDEVISQFTEEEDLDTYKRGKPSNDQELENLQHLAKIHPLGALLSAWSYFEKKVDEFAKEATLDHRLLSRRTGPLTFELTRGKLSEFGIHIPEELLIRINQIRQVRNMAAHGRAEPSKEEVIETIKVIEEIEEYLRSLDTEEIKMRIENMI